MTREYSKEGNVIRPHKFIPKLNGCVFIGCVPAGTQMQSFGGELYFIMPDGGISVLDGDKITPLSVTLPTEEVLVKGFNNYFFTDGWTP